MVRRWIDRAEPRPSSSLIYASFDGKDSVLRIELAANQPGAMITLELFPDQLSRTVVINGDEAQALARRLQRLGERANSLTPGPPR